MQTANMLLPTIRGPSRLLSVFATLIHLGFGVASPASADQMANRSGMTKLAEMAAFARHADECPSVPEQWSSALVTLLILHYPPEQAIDDQEQKALALRDRIGRVKWCKLYATEMEEAFLVLRMATER